MSDQNSILPEITGLAAGIVMGAMTMVIGRLLFSNGVIPTYTGNWIQSNYDPAALVVWGISTLLAIVWYMISLRWWRTFTPKESNQSRYVWILLFFISTLSCIISLFFWGKDGDNNLEVVALFLLGLVLALGMFLSYWLSTALSTPPNMCHVVPLTRLFRR